MPVRSFLYRNLNINFSILGHAGCNIQFYWLGSFQGFKTFNSSSICISILERVTSKIAKKISFCTITLIMFYLYYIKGFYNNNSLYMGKNKYDLRSAKSEGIQVPVQLQLLDSEFELAGKKHFGYGSAKFSTVLFLK